MTCEDEERVRIRVWSVTQQLTRGYQQEDCQAFFTQADIKLGVIKEGFGSGVPLNINLGVG